MSEPMLYVSPGQLWNIAVNVKLSRLPLRTNFTEAFLWVGCPQGQINSKLFLEGNYRIFYDWENWMDPISWQQRVLFLTVPANTTYFSYFLLYL